MFTWIQRMDNRILMFIGKHMRCRVLDVTMPLASLVGNVGAIWGLVMAAFLITPKFRQFGIRLFGVLLLCGILTNFILKPLVSRPRPCHRNLERELLLERPQDYSFPSGHTMSSFGAAMVVFHVNTYWGIAAFTLAAVIAFSRMYLYVHYPSDVFCGAFLGLFALTPWVLVCAGCCAIFYYGITRYRRRTDR